MKHLKIGVRLESLGALPLRKALAAAARLEVGGVQVDAVGELLPDRLSQTGRRELRNLLRTSNLELTALGCPLRRGLDAAEDQQGRLDHVRKVLALAYDLGPRVVIVQAGQVPAVVAEGEKVDSAELDRARRLRESLAELGAHGDRVGATLALETGLESGVALAAYLKSFDSGSLAANLDPANLLLHGFDPIQAARDLRGLIAHAHAHDCRRGSTSRAAREAAVGAGDIDWLAFLETLEEVEYRGWLVVEREEGDNRLADVEAGVRFLRRLVG
jgi:sugar phosphate isomerase/epimerase